MVFLIILAVLLLLIALILLVPLKVKLDFNEALRVEVSLFSRWVFVYPEPIGRKLKREKKKALKKLQPEPKKNFLKDYFRKKGVCGGVCEIAQVVKTILLRVFRLLKRVKIERCDLRFVVATADAANTALTYGRVCAVLFPLFTVISERYGKNCAKLDVSTDFEVKNPELEFHLVAELRLYHIAVTALYLLFDFLKGVLKNERK